MTSGPVQTTTSATFNITCNITCAPTAPPNVAGVLPAADRVHYPIKFRDIRTFTGSTTFLCPNECLNQLRKLADMLTFEPKVGGSIASGGEVPLTVMLPKVETLRIVDHNYGSLFWTCTKILMLKHMSNKDLRLFINVGYFRFLDLAAELAIENPLAKYYIKPSQTLQTSALMEAQYERFRNFWRTEVPDTILDMARERLDNIEVIHGDIRDMGDDIDFLYISNALGHSPYDMYDVATKDRITHTEFRAQVRDVMSLGGIVISTSSLPDDCNQLYYEPEVCDHGNGWHYYLGRRIRPSFVTRRFEYLAVLEERKTPMRAEYYMNYNGKQSRSLYHMSTNFRKLNTKLNPYKELYDQADIQEARPTRRVPRVRHTAAPQT